MSQILSLGIADIASPLTHHRLFNCSSQLRNTNNTGQYRGGGNYKGDIIEMNLMDQIYTA